MLSADSPGEQFGQEAQTLAEVVIKAYGAGVVELHLHKPRFAVTPSERPVASPLARMQAQRGPMVTSLLYNTVRFEDLLGRQLLSLLDGTRDRTMLVEEFGRLIEEAQGSSPSTDPVVEGEKQTLAAQLEEKLKALGRLGFLLE